MVIVLCMICMTIFHDFAWPFFMILHDYLTVEMYTHMYYTSFFMIFWASYYGDTLVHNLYNFAKICSQKGANYCNTKLICKFPYQWLDSNLHLNCWYLTRESYDASSYLRKLSGPGLKCGTQNGVTLELVPEIYRKVLNGCKCSIC